MVVIILHTKEVIKFSMNSKTSEKALVNKFTLGSMSTKSKLKLPQLNRELTVAEILDMKYIDNWQTKKKEPKVDYASQFADIFGCDIFGNMKK